MLVIVKVKHNERKENWVMENNTVPTEDVLCTWEAYIKHKEQSAKFHLS